MRREGTERTHVKMQAQVYWVLGREMYADPSACSLPAANEDDEALH